MFTVNNFSLLGGHPSIRKSMKLPSNLYFAFNEQEAVDNVQKRSLSIVLKADRARHQVSTDFRK